MKEWISSIAFAIFVGLMAIACRHQGNVQLALGVAACVALWLSMRFFPGMPWRGKK
jgi:hypothetical protein